MNRIDFLNLSQDEKLMCAQRIITEYHLKVEASHYLAAYKAEESSYWKPLLHVLDRLLASRDHMKVLDIGTAYGTLLLYSVLSGASGCGLDMSDLYWSKELESDYDISWSKCNIESESIPSDNLYDIIIFTEILEHMNYNPIPVFNKLNQSLLPGGSVLLSTPWARFFVSNYHSIDVMDLPYYQPGNSFVDAEFKYFTADEMMAIAMETGFTIKHLENYNGHLIVEMVKN